LPRHAILRKFLEVSDVFFVTAPLLSRMPRPDRMFGRRG
jgi:hypothetical protein